MWCQAASQYLVKKKKGWQISTFTDDQYINLSSNQKSQLSYLIPKTRNNDNFTTDVPFS